MEDRDMVIKEIKSALRVKSDEAEQQKLRAEMHESRAERIGLESEEKSRKQQAEFDMLKGPGFLIFFDYNFLNNENFNRTYRLNL